LRSVTSKNETTARDQSFAGVATSETIMLTIRSSFRSVRAGNSAWKSALLSARVTISSQKIS
jgi:hypothetical protein